MREILFRGFCKGVGKWVYGSLVHQTDYHGDKVDRYFIIDGTTTADNDIGIIYEVVPKTVSQYTGVNGKTGKAIFEHQVISSIIGGKWEKAPVRFKNGCFMIDVNRSGGNIPEPLSCLAKHVTSVEWYSQFEDYSVLPNEIGGNRS